jgi:hypothetical protein
MTKLKVQINVKVQNEISHLVFDIWISFGRKVPRKPRAVHGVKGHNTNDIALPGSPGLWPGSFTFELRHLDLDF